MKLSKNQRLYIFTDYSESSPTTKLALFNNTWIDGDTVDLLLNEYECGEKIGEPFYHPNIIILTMSQYQSMFDKDVVENIGEKYAQELKERAERLANAEFYNDLAMEQQETL